LGPFRKPRALFASRTNWSARTCEGKSMRVTSREQADSRAEFVRRCRLVAISAVPVIATPAGGGRGGGGRDDGGARERQPPPAPPPPANVAPTVEAGADQTIEWPPNTVEVSGTAEDDSSTSLSYEWSATSGPTGVTFASATAAATTVTFPS